MCLVQRAKCLSLLLCFIAGMAAYANNEADPDENREAYLGTGDNCPIHAIIAVELGDARERFEDFERQLMLAGLIGNSFQNAEVVEQRVGRHRFEEGLSAHQTMFINIVKRRLEAGERRVSGHGVLEEMRPYFSEPLQHNRLFPLLRKIGVDSSLAWEQSSLFIHRAFSYLERPGMGGHGVRKTQDGTVYAVARIESELFFYLYQPGYVGPRKGRLGVFEWRKPHKPVGRPEHVAAFFKYLQDHDISIIPEN